MADKSEEDDLSYGHFGHGSYDVDNQSWHFTHSPQDRRVLKPLGQPREIAPPAIETSTAHEDTGTETASKRHARQVQSLIKDHPDFQPASELLSPLLRVSEAVEKATARHDPLKGDLLACGTIPSGISHRAVAVVAFPCGPSGSDLCIARLQDQRRGWDDSRDAWIEVPVVRGEQAVWKGAGAPIQQISFANAIEGSDAFLTVRFVNRTLIFRPTLRQQSFSIDLTSCLEPNLVHEVGVELTGGLQHADVSFNPWYTRQFGVIDTAGKWMIWELEGRTSSRAKGTCRGTLDLGPSARHNAFSDGWARLTWAGGPSTIVICTRSKLCVVDISGPGPEMIGEGALEPLETIRDVCRLPSHPGHFCVLTSSRLSVYPMKTSTDDKAIRRPLVSARHFKNPEDLSLSLSAFSDQEDIVLLIRSRLDALATQHRLHVAGSMDMTISDPWTFTVPEIALRVGTKRLEFNVRRLNYGAKKRAVDGPAAAVTYRERDVRFYLATVLHDDLGLSQQLYAASLADSLHGAAIEPSWESTFAAPAPSPAKLQKESYIVDDREHTIIGPGSCREPPRSRFTRRRIRQANVSNDKDWTVDYQLVAREVETTRPNSARALAEALDLVEGLLRRKRTAGLLPLQTLRDFSGDRTITDLDLASERLERLALVQPDSPQATQQTDIDEVEEVSQASTQLVLHKIQALVRSFTNDATLEQIYDTMVADWISSLSPQVPGKIRLAKEQLVRRAAAEVALASRVLRIENEPQPAADSQPTQQTWDLPVRAGASSSAFLPSSQLQSSQQSVLPTPSPSATPSIATSSSHPSTLTAPAISRLSRYTTFAKPPTTALPRSLSNVLSHWTPGTDPSTYDWLSTSRHISQRQDEELDDQAMTERERARVQRRAERHIRRQRREAEASQAAQLASSQAPEIISASQPPQRMFESQPGGGVVGSSQSQGFGGLVAASQVVPGRFGARPPAKKKRKQGF